MLLPVHNQGRAAGARIEKVVPYVYFPESGVHHPLALGCYVVV